MIEIALCLAIIGFGLIAIIGVLPAGLNVQKNNREETIINQDAQVWMDAIRNGAQGYDYLTNYVTKITLTQTRYRFQGNTATPQPPGTVAVFTPDLTSTYPLTNGYRIVGLLSTPQIVPIGGTEPGFWSNNVVAEVRSISGPAVEKFPQTNETVLDSSFAYRLVVENAQLPVDWPPVARGKLGQPATTNIFQDNFQANSRDLRLLFRWPLLPGDKTGTGRQTFRAFVGGWTTNETVQLGRTAVTLYFFEPSTYVQASTQ